LWEAIESKVALVTIHSDVIKLAWTLATTDLTDGILCTINITCAGYTGWVAIVTTSTTEMKK
jgi:hypothetical protein